MTSELRVDKIHNEGGDNDSGIDLSTNDQIVLKTANTTRLTMNATGQTTIVGEGGSTTTSVQQGLAKVWVCVTQTSTQALNDSLNVSGITDNGTGETTCTYTNAPSNSNYAVSIAEGNAQNRHAMYNANNTTRLKLEGWEHASINSPVDCETIGASVHGDLA